MTSEMAHLTSQDKQECWRKTYRDAVLRTAGPIDSHEGTLTMGALGLAGEAGEVADEIKKIVFHKKPTDRDKIVKELGDVRWYLEYVAAVFNISMREIEETNVAKLQARYPNGFTEHTQTRREE